MFDSSYFERVHLVDNQKGTSENHEYTKLYSFKGNVSIYLVQVEKYNFDVYVLKFFLKNHKDSKNRFNLLSDDHDAQGVIRTVLDIAIDILENENENASFGFVGAHKVKGELEEPKSNTQRFRVYRYIMKNYFGDDTWSHFESIDSSSYLMLNTRTYSSEERIDEIVDMFKGIYDEFEDRVIEVTQH